MACWVEPGKPVIEVEARSFNHPVSMSVLVPLEDSRRVNDRFHGSASNERKEQSQR